VELDVTEARVEEAGEGLRAPPADLGIGAEGKPPLGHATEAAERPVGHPGQDLDQGVLRQARRGLLRLLVLMFLQMGETVQFRFVLIPCNYWIEDRKSKSSGANLGRRWLGGGERRRRMGWRWSGPAADLVAGRRRVARILAAFFPSS
jgi:hypothetical protein